MYQVRWGQQIKLSCDFSFKKKDVWSVKELDDKFATLWKFMGKNRIKRLLGIPQFNRADKCLMIHIVGSVFKALNVTDVFTSDGYVDFEKAMRPLIVNEYTDELLGFINYCKMEHQLAEHMQSDAGYQTFFEKLQDVSDAWKATLVTEEEEADVEPDVAPQIAAVDGEVFNLHSLYIKVCEIVQEFTTYKSISLLFTPAANATQQHMKDVIRIALMLPYLRIREMDVERLSANAGHTLQNMLTGLDQSVNKWVLWEAPAHKESTVLARVDILTKLEQGSFKELHQLADKLPMSGGFLYGVNLLCLQEHSLKKVLKGFLVKNVQDKYRCLSGDNAKKLPNKGDMIDWIVKHNPHNITNAVTSTDGSNLMWLPWSMLIKIKGLNSLGGIIYIGIHICELLTMIYSSKGRNEHMGIPDSPEKGPIWSSPEDLKDIFMSLVSFEKWLKSSADTVPAASLKDALTDYNDMVATIPYLFEGVDIEQAKAFVEKHKVMLENMTGMRDIHKLSDSVPFVFLAFVIIQNALKEEAATMLLLKDINLLHLVGYLGFLMLGDNVYSHSRDADLFKVTNTCKFLFERYIMRLHEDDDPNPTLYYTTSSTSASTSRENELIDALKALSYGNDTLLGILNSHTCLHGIGGSLCALYLFHLNKLQIARLNGTLGRYTPQYMSEDRFKPLPMFQNMYLTGDVYRVAVVSEDVPSKVRLLLDEKRHIPGETSLGSTVSILEINVNTRGRIWLQRAVFKGPVIPHETSEQFAQYQTYLGEPFANINNVALYATITMSKHPIEHFRLVCRYCIDHAHMISEYYRNGTLKDTEEQIGMIEFQNDKPYVYPSDDGGEYTAQDKEKLKAFLYTYHFNYLFQDEEDVKQKFQTELEHTMNVNADVVRDFDKQSMVPVSELVYFMDVLSNITTIYDRGVRTGEKQMFGVVNKTDGMYLGDALFKLLENDKTDRKKTKKFNETLIQKGVMSQIIMDFVHAQIHNNHGNQGNQGPSEKARNTAVDQHLVYMNLQNLLITKQEKGNFDKSQIKLVHSIVANALVWMVIRIIIISTFPHMPEYKPFANLFANLGRQVFGPMYLLNMTTTDLSLKDVLEGNFDVNDDDDYNEFQFQETINETNELMVSSIYESVYALMSFFYDENVPQSYKFHAYNMTLMKDLLVDVDKELNKENWKESVSKMIDVYCNANADILPSDDGNSILDKAMFGQDLIEQTHRNNMLNSLTMPLQQLMPIFNKMSEMDEFVFTQTPKDTLDLLYDVLQGHTLDDASKMPLVKELIGLSESNKIQSLCNIISSIMISKPHVSVSVDTFRQNLLSLVCFTAFDNAHLY